MKDGLFSPAALLWCAVTVNIKTQSPATPMPLISKSLSAGARYGWWSLQTNPEWGGFAVPPPTLQILHCKILRATLSHYHPVGTPSPKSVKYTRDNRRKGPYGSGCKMKFSLICGFSFSLLCTYLVVAIALFQFRIAGEWLTWRPCGEGQALAAIKLTCLRYQGLCFLTM